MTHIRRFTERNIPYALTTVTKDRAPLFKDRKFCRILLVTIEYHKTIFDFLVHGFCVMPDHLHLLLTPQGKFNVSFIMKMIKGSFARKINKLAGRNGSVWQRRFYDEIIRSEKQFLEQLRYMHHNPIKAGLARTAGDYEFSSYRQYMSNRRSNDYVLEISPIAVTASAGF